MVPVGQWLERSTRKPKRFRVFGVSCCETTSKTKSATQGKPLEKKHKKFDTFTILLNKKEI